jgi:dTDP-glucose 4,6-dehydratase
MDPWDGRVVSTFIRQALANEPLTIFGDGTQTRSFCFIDDLVSAIIAMGKSSQTGPINLGNPKEHTLLELANLVHAIIGGSKAIEFLELPEDDPKRRNPDISRARKLLNWEPTLGIEKGIELTAAWMRSSLNRS